VVYFGAALSIIVFIVAFQRLRVLPTAVTAAQAASHALAATRDPSLSDDQKEQLARKTSLQLMGSFLSILARGAGAVGASLLPLLAMQSLGLADIGTVLDTLTSWQTILVVSVVLTPLYFFSRKKDGDGEAS